MRALQDQSSNDGIGRFYAIGSSRIGAWSVLPLHAREAANGRSRPAFHGNAAIDLLEQPEVAEDVQVLRFLGECIPPAVAEREAVATPAAEPAAEEAQSVVSSPDANDFRLATDGDLVALGTLACVLTSVFSVSAVAGLALSVF